MRFRLERSVQLCCLQHKEGRGPVGVGPQKATKVIRGLEHFSCEDKLHGRITIQSGEGKALEETSLQPSGA